MKKFEVITEEGETISIDFEIIKTIRDFIDCLFNSKIVEYIHIDETNRGFIAYCCRFGCIPNAELRAKSLEDYSFNPCTYIKELPINKAISILFDESGRTVNFTFEQ